ncbi:6235_t:CDS:2, partial [Racocetra persica]
MWQKLSQNLQLVALQEFDIKEKSGAENQFRHKFVKFPKLELAIRTWVQQIITANMLLSDHLLREKGIKDPEAARLKKDLELYCTIVNELLATEDVMNDNEILVMVYEIFNSKQV